MNFLRVLIASLPVSVLAAELPLPAKVEFNRDIRPILSENCFKCHGFDKEKRKGDRRLDTREGALAENYGLRAIVPGKPGESDVHLRIHSEDKDEKMPPRKSGKVLTARQIALLDQWIEQGAEYQPHWAYIAPRRPAVPASQEQAFEKNAIDALVLARQREIGVAHAPEADRRTLIRRLSFDLTGLPPAAGEVDAFVQDASPDAYEKVVDRLLAAPEYGERMAVAWLDLVRYADTIGIHSDNPRNVWPYRDYVIRAFNENKPFDQFTIEQLAGDLLPNSTLAQKVASGFNRLNLTTEEGGAQAADYEARTVADRVRAVGTVWLAQTTGCCQCHDHKYDPITARDFYRLGAFFADIKESAIGRREDGLLVPTPEQEQNMKALDIALSTAQTAFDAMSPELAEAQAAWERESADPVVWTPLHPAPPLADEGSQLTVRADESIKVELAGNAAADTYRILVTLPAGATGLRLEALPSDSLPGRGPGRAGDGNFVLSEIKVEREAGVFKFARAAATFEQKGFEVNKAIDGIADKKDNGWAIKGHAPREASATFELAEPLAAEESVSVVLQQSAGGHQTLGKFRLSVTTTAKPAEKASLAPDLVAIFQIEASKRSAEQVAKLTAHYRTIAPLLDSERRQLATARRERDEFEKPLARSLVSEAMATPRTVRLLPRGNWLDLTGEIAAPGVPAFLPQPPAGDRRLTRLDLAQWLVSREQPLTARVFVNRLWKLTFGVGLSKVLDDFGAQGESPLNPALLDWLACEFMESKWDVKHMMRLIVTSGVYRQDSRSSKEMLQRDPDNRELARQSRFRLDAEFVRDNALAISGLLVRRLGGASAKPYQPAGYWENLNFPTREWEPSADDNQWRRGLYTWWQRSYLHPSLAAFDAPSREECTAERSRSNIPQQALVLLNDPTYVEAARALAGRILREAVGDTTQRLTWAFREALGRPPRADELQVTMALFGRHLSAYANDPAAAEKLLKTGIAPQPEGLNPAELAAWTSVARVILNLHETITRS